MKIDLDNLTENLVAKALNITDYQEIIKTYKQRNLSVDLEYQKIFNRFYRVRRNEEWRKIFYDYFEANKDNGNITFEEILYYIFEQTGQIEHSFSSKMLSTINPQMPIWDIYILNHIGLELSGKTKEQQLANRVALYNLIIDWYNDFLSSSDGVKCVNAFDTLMPNYTWLNSVKKIDYIIWGVRC